MRLTSALALACGLTACGLEDEQSVGEAEFEIQTRRTLDHDLVLGCGSGARAASYSTSFQIELDEGDTLLVGGDALAEYVTFGDNPWWGDDKTDELVQTWLACAAGTTISLQPAASAQLSRTGQNVWQDSGEGNVSDAHGTRGIYTATESGTHICWLIYSCSPVDEWDNASAGQVMIRETSSIHHYSPNEYPGESWKLETNVPITSDNPTTVQVETWNAAAAETQWDTEVMARWLPHVSTCLSNDSYCDGLVDHFGLGFEWRLRLHQYNAGTLCNAAVGSWTYEACSDSDHHCGVKVFSTAFPIISGPGNHASCGTALGPRTFRVFAQMKKASDEAVAADLVVHGAPGNPYTNLVLYSR